MESKNGLHSKWRPANKSNKKPWIYLKKYGNIFNLWKTISRAAQYRDDPDRNVISLSKHLQKKSNSKY